MSSLLMELVWVAMCCGVTGNTPNQGPDMRSLGEKLLASLERNHGKAEENLFSPAFISHEGPKSVESGWVKLTEEYGGYRECSVVATYQLKGLYGATMDARFDKGGIWACVVANTRGQVEGLWWLGPVSQDYSDGTGHCREEACVIGKEPWQIEGTMTYPRQQPISRIPGVVLVHGSGPQDRDETIMARRPFRDIAAGLAERGVAVLRYDKRTYAYEARYRNMEPSEISVDGTIVDDAVYALRYIEKLPSVDPNGLFLVGHSLGGYLAPVIASRHGHVRGIAILGGASRPIHELLTEQIARQEKDGESEAERKQRREILEGLKRVGAGVYEKNEVIAGAPAGFLFELSRSQSVSIASRLPCAILIAQGDRDENLLGTTDYRGWEAGLKNHRASTFRLYKDLDHLFMHNAGDSKFLRFAKPAHVDPQFIADLAEWIIGVSARELKVSGTNATKIAASTYVERG